MWHQFYLENDSEMKVQIFRLGCLIDTSLKVNEMSLSLQERKLTVFVANEKIRAFMWKLKSWKIWIWYRELETFSTLEDFSDEISVHINTWSFWNCIMKHCTIWKIFINQWANILQMTNAWCHTIKAQQFSCKSVWKMHWYGFSFHNRTNLFRDHLLNGQKTS